MAPVIIALRALHILGTVFWTGGTLVLYLFVLPAALATQPESRRFMQRLAGQSGMPSWLTIASIAAVVGGLGLYAPVTGQMDPALMGTPRGIALSLGALLGLGAFFEGLFVLRPTAARMGALVATLATTGGAPPADHAAQLGALQAKLLKTGRRGAVMLLVAGLLMAIARYL